MPSTGADGFVVSGHEACRQCGDWYVAGTRPGRLCAACTAEVSATSRTLEIAHSVNGRTVVNRPTRARKRRKPTANELESKRLWNQARSRALQRLARIHHPLYLLLLSEEKAALGLDPRLDERASGAGPIERELAG